MPRAKTRPGSQQLAVMAAAAKKWHVPLWILVGIYGIETGFGSNVATSSAGAQGPFQFIPSTAAAYHVNVNSFASSADGAAHLMSDLHKQYGSWDSAATHYSGGGYGISEVRAKVPEAPKALLGKTTPQQLLTSFLPFQAPIPGLPDPLVPHIPTPNPGSISPGSLLSLPSEVITAARGFTDIAKMLTSAQFWIRVGEAVAGLTLLHMGMKNLSGDYAETAGGVRRAGELATGYEATTRGAARQTAKRVNAGKAKQAGGAVKKAAAVAVAVPK